jgi:hypothetical protein
MGKVDISKIKFSNDRNDLRKEIINTFLNENPGTGKGNLTSRYQYVTKVLDDGREVYLSRPANFNNGFDFTLNVSGTNFNKGLGKRASTRPTHDNIFQDLRNKKKENLNSFKLLQTQIDLIYNCQNPAQTKFDFKSGHPSELILECIKWLFVEQDVTYWNYSGRTMFYGGIKGI